MCEGGIMVALSFLLSFIKVLDMPFGGSVTACSMVPIILIAYRYANKLPWALMCSFLFSALQLLMDFSGLRRSMGWESLIAVLVLDYFLAFTVLGLSGVFKKCFPTQIGGLLAGTGLVCLLRYLCHLISGCTVWAGVSVPSADGFLYSLLYNAAYMVPETILSLSACFYVGKLLDLNTLKGLPVREKGGVLTAVCWLLGIAAVVFDSIYLFANMMNEEGYDITLVTRYDLLLSLAVLAAAAAVIAVISLICKKIR